MVQTALAADKTDGVKAAALKIEKLSHKLNAEGLRGEHAKHYAALPKTIRVAAQRLRKAKDIATMRDAFKELSRPMVAWVTMSKPAGIYVMFCSMAKASWLQKDKPVRNPYYGASMPACGEIIQ